MAACIRNRANLTAVIKRLVYLEGCQRTITTTVPCAAGSWTIRSKSKREKVLYQAPEANAQTIEQDVQEIVIPKKIERSPTAILEALASTVKNDVNQPMYLSIDDPHLYATSDRIKKNFMAAKESGRQAAQAMLTMNPDHFSQIWEDPLPESLADVTKGYCHNEPSETALLERIAKRRVKDSVDCYNALVDQNQEVSQETLHNLLELLTVYSCKEPENDSQLGKFIDPAMFGSFAPFPVSTWQKGNEAEKVFEALPEKTPRSYCYMIRSMAMNFEKEGALRLYNEMKAQNMPVDTFTYNKLLLVASLDCESIDEVEQLVTLILKDMAANNVHPDEVTFANALRNCRRLSRWTGAKKFALSLITEMRACGIEPSLTSSLELLQIFYYFKDKTPKTADLFEDILNQLEGQELEFKTENAVLFFRNAMRVVASHFPDSKLALRVHKLAKAGKNHDFVGHRQSLYGYYKDLFTVITPLEHTDVVMDIYNSTVPYIFLPTSEVYLLIFENIDMYDSYHYIPQLFADIQWTSMFKDNPFFVAFVKLMAKQKLEPQLQGQLCDIATHIIKDWLERRSVSRDIPNVDGAALGSFITVFLNNDDLKSAWSLYEIYTDDDKVRGNDPSDASLSQLAEHLIQAQDYEKVKTVLGTMLDLGSENISDLVDKTVQTMTLTDQEKNYLQGLADEASSSSSSSSSSDSD